MFDKNQVLSSSCITFRENKSGKKTWFLVQNENGDWEFPKTTVRKVESSVRASIRMTGEQAGMTVRVLEEAGRAGGVTTIGNKTVPIRYIYYLAIHLSDSGEAIGFDKTVWIDDTKVVRTLTTKRDQQMYKQAKKVLKIWEKEKKHLQPAEEEVLI